MVDTLGGLAERSRSEVAEPVPSAGRKAAARRAPVRPRAAHRLVPLHLHCISRRTS